MIYNIYSNRHHKLFGEQLVQTQVTPVISCHISNSSTPVEGTSPKIFENLKMLLLVEDNCMNLVNLPPLADFDVSHSFHLLK